MIQFPLLAFLVVAAVLSFSWLFLSVPILLILWVFGEYMQVFWVLKPINSKSLLFSLNLVYSRNNIVSKEPIIILWYFFSQVQTCDTVRQKLCDSYRLDLVSYYHVTEHILEAHNYGEYEFCCGCCDYSQSFEQLKKCITDIYFEKKKLDFEPYSPSITGNLCYHYNTWVTDVYMAYMLGRNFGGKTSKIEWLFESNLRTCGYFKCSMALWVLLDPNY